MLDDISGNWRSIRSLRYKKQVPNNYKQVKLRMKNAHLTMNLQFLMSFILLDFRM